MAEYAYYELVHSWPELILAINQLEIRLRTQKRPVGADILLRGLTVFRADLERLGLDMAAFATEALRRHERDSRVRPDTAGQGGPRLGDNLLAEPLLVGLVPGSIGVANETHLDHSVPWWITNEIGSSANVGRQLFGAFFEPGGEAAPHGDLFREDALFRPGAGPFSGVGYIENAIPARRFIAAAVPDINAEWQSRFLAAKSRFDLKMTEALASPV
ncbi:MAG: hypothetical protein M3Y33_17630 [Actinomycetota bacterium]|nr:hypothetical protein [Actinomycetota bacterium]